MKIVRLQDLDFIPASHEDPKDPGALKKVLLKRGDLPEGRIQMINWSKIPVGKTFAPHYHQSMIEVFIIMSGKVKVKIDNEEAILEKGDMIIAMEKQVHTMTNIGDKDVDYFAMGVATSEGGKSVNV
ncbi:hypothetical protein A3B45_00785 [Candidatus Daviesbacteria bacterium RIFCSPLOWO2_01_FULL_39_12]|uniref:Cupin type-2 domain-containing protein n=1 Tax=Candidatus Daviesbacteria bacterium RIFCSPLOWO2_01_FULL_39_12 TaxID=1797785 RepID=A0A1F5KQM8_9BACT|nr:MAG: hypothetical protein A3D79_01905 [Candidatus Daviesbacteria bacterium RIFCSPHIGHO2_02_FULL_39_8]OGE43243.1 MAG: hypothetical protein A3B45_00785 [Candidatus Daviesbacteria bacterium RIFCSPLOWO2_01_FULL_39_12]